MANADETAQHAKAMLVRAIAALPVHINDALTCDIASVFISVSTYVLIATMIYTTAQVVFDTHNDFMVNPSGIL